MENKEDKFPALKNLLAGSFYQCWSEFDGRPASEIVDEAVSESSKEQLQASINEIDEIFKLLTELGGLEQIIGYDIGCNYDSEDDGISHVEWFVGLKRKLQSSYSR